MRKGGDSGKAYHVKRIQNLKKKRRKELRKQIKKAKSPLLATSLRVLLALED